jgi:hypothetical protein
MAEVTVFVDDAVLGRLPAICVKDGVATTDRLTLDQDVGWSPGFGLACLLLLAGPLGWIGLFVLGAVGGDSLTVTLPYSEVAHNRVRRAGRRDLGRRHGGGFALPASAHDGFSSAGRAPGRGGRRRPGQRVHGFIPSSPPGGSRGSGCVSTLGHLVRRPSFFCRSRTGEKQRRSPPTHLTSVSRLDDVSESLAVGIVADEWRLDDVRKLSR